MFLQHATLMPFLLVVEFSNQILQPFVSYLGTSIMLSESCLTSGGWGWGRRKQGGKSYSLCQNKLSQLAIGILCAEL